MRIEIWRAPWDIVPLESEDGDYTDAGYDFMRDVDKLCVELITTEQLKDKFVKLCKDAIDVEVRWECWRLRTEQDSKAA